MTPQGLYNVLDVNIRPNFRLQCHIVELLVEISCYSDSGFIDVSKFLFLFAYK